MDRLSSETSLPPEWYDRVRSELGSGEHVLWAEQPRADRYARRSLPIMLFGAAFASFSLFWIAAAWVMIFGLPGREQPVDDPSLPFRLFPYFGILFVLVGLGMLSSPLWFGSQAKRTCYALTNRRAIIWQLSMFCHLTVRSYGPEALAKLTRTEHPDGSGDLILEETVEFGTDNDGHRTSWIRQNGFMAISNVKDVEMLVRRTLAVLTK